MRKKLGMYSSFITFISVVVYAIILLLIRLFNFDTIVNKGIYFTSFFIGFGTLCMVYSYFSFMKNEDKLSGIIALIISIIHSILFIVLHHRLYFKMHIDAIYFELFINMRIFGYVLLSVATMFIGLTLKTNNKREKVLKFLMSLHFVFGLCFLILLFEMLLNVRLIQYNDYGLIIKFWCLYYSVICFLSFIHFKKK